MNLHKVLIRQLKRLGLSHEAVPPSLHDWECLLQKISKAYTEADQDRYLLERSLHKSSTEMQERWQALRAMEEQWRSLGECAPDLILMVNLDGYVTFANRGRGVYSQEEMIGKRLESLYLLPDNRAAMGAFKQALNKSSSKIEIRGLGPNHEGLCYSQRMTPIEKDGQVTGVLVVETDITEQIKMQKEIEMERARAIHSSKFATLGEMAGGIAHEINTPLSTIQLFANLLRESAESAEIEKEQSLMIADKIESTVGRISKIIRGLRTFARQSDGDPFVTCEVSKIIEEAMDLMGEKLRNHGVRVEIDAGPKGLAIECRPTQITQIIMNMCSNSVDALEDAENKWIEIKAVDRGESAELTVTDGGSGIPRSVREKIMQPFLPPRSLARARDWA
jgi:PAS domain S-box-containing protein